MSNHHLIPENTKEIALVARNKRLYTTGYEETILFFYQKSHDIGHYYSTEQKRRPKNIIENLIDIGTTKDSCEFIIANLDYKNNINAIQKHKYMIMTCLNTHLVTILSIIEQFPMFKLLKIVIETETNKNNTILAKFETQFKKEFTIESNTEDKSQMTSLYATQHESIQNLKAIKHKTYQSWNDVENTIRDALIHIQNDTLKKLSSYLNIKQT